MLERLILNYRWVVNSQDYFVILRMLGKMFESLFVKICKPHSNDQDISTTTRFSKVFTRIIQML